MLKNSFRRTMSVMIALVMIWTTFCIGQPLTASATVTSSTPNNATGVYLVVPEAIYLRPVYNSYYTSSTSTFQWFVNNTLSGNSITTTSGEENTGKLYFRYANATGAKLSFEWLNSSGQATTGGTITVGGKTLEAKADSTMSVSSSDSAINITAGNSPSLDKAATGAYIRWTVTYTDSGDKRQKTVQAYTYVYKPYVEPVGVAHRTVNDRGTNHYGQNISWISGVHDTDSAALGSHYPNSDSGHGLLALSSSDTRNNAPQVGELYAQMSSYFYWSWSGNEGAGGWLNTTSAPQLMPDKSFRYIENTLTGHSSGSDAFHNFGYAPTAVLTVDISRYSNLTQIPNLSVGLMVTDDEASDSGAAYFISNYTGTPATEDNIDYFKNNTSHAEEIWNRYNAAGGDVFAAGTYSNPSASEAEGIKYNGRWKNKSLGSTQGTSTYYLGAGYYNHQSGDSIWNISELRMKVNRYDKGTLRTAVNKAINNSATLQSIFYNTSASAWTNYVNLFRSASLMLTKVDGTFSVTVNGTTYTDPKTMATALDGAIDTLLSGSGRLTSRTATQTNVVLQQQANGTYVYAPFLNGTTTRTVNFKTFDSVTFTADVVPGYTFIGLQSAASAPTPVMNAATERPTTFTTTAEGATINNGTVTYTHTDTTGTDTNGNLYYTYYYVVNTYTVHYDANGGTGTMADQAFTYNVGQNLTANNFTRQGYTFAGWAKTATGNVAYENGASVNNLTTTANGTVNLFAKWNTVDYTIQYDTVGGSITSTNHTTTYNINSTVMMPTASKDGYTLTGWKANSAGNWGPLTYNAGEATSGKYGDVSLTAVWKAVNYSVAFDKNGGTGAQMSNQNFSYGTSQSLSANAYTRDGFTFRGWALTSTATDPVYIDRESVSNLTTTANAVVTLYAVWGVNNYTITYSTDSGVIRDASYTRSFTVNDVIALPTTVEKTGYTFSGWKPAGNSGTWNAETVYTGTVNSGMIGNVTLQAQWTKDGYAITYVLLDGTMVGTKYTTTYDISTAITIPQARKTGYTFGGWLSDGAGNWGVSVYQNGNISAGRYGDVTLTAQWTGVQYYVQFNGNNSTSGMMYNQSFTYGEPGTLNPNEYVRGGYQFKGWATTANATTAAYADRGTVLNLSPQAGSTVTLFAVWEKENYTITYDPAGGTITTPGVTLYGITDTVTLPTVTRTGYTLNGWRPTENSGSWHTWDTYTGTVPAGSYGNVTLQALWTKDTYTITYDAQNGTMSGDYTTTYDVDTPIVLPSVTRTGYKFNGWQASAAWNYVTITNNQAPAGALGNVTLTAIWTQKIYYIHFNSNGGSGSMTNQLMRFDESQALTANAFTRDGYNFAGWATTETGSVAYPNGDIVLNLSQTDGAIVNLYAVWTARNFTLTYNMNGAQGGLPGSNVVMDGAAITLRAYNIEQTEINNQPFAFGGWAYTKEEADAGTVAYANKASFSLNAEVLERATIDWTTTKPTITLYAVWIGVSVDMIIPEGATTVVDEDRGFIYGLKAGITREELLNDYLGVIGNGRLEISQGTVGTGTVVQLIDNFNNQVLEEYQIVIFGDTNGDGLANSTDVTNIRLMNAGLLETSFNDVYTFAADLNGDNNVNSTDVTTIRMINAGTVEYDQVTREII